MIYANVVAVVAILTIFIGVIVKIIGMPAQIKKNHRRKSTEGLSPVYWILAFVSYVMWMIYGALQNDIVLMIGQGIGTIPTGIIVWQIYMYRPPKSEKPPRRPRRKLVWKSASTK